MRKWEHEKNRKAWEGGNNIHTILICEILKNKFIYEKSNAEHMSIMLWDEKQGNFKLKPSLNYRMSPGKPSRENV